MNKTKQTALHWAAKRGYSSICELLLNKGAGVDVLDLVKPLLNFCSHSTIDVKDSIVLCTERRKPYNSPSKKINLNYFIIERCSYP